MALTSETIIDKIELVGPYRHVQIREAKVIKEDGVEVARSFHRRVIDPDAVIDDEPDEIKAICSAVHTPNIKAAFKRPS